MKKDDKKQNNYKGVLKSLYRKRYLILVGMLVCSVLITSPNYFSLLRGIKTNAYNYILKNISTHDNLEPLVSYVRKNIDMNNNLTYLYLDNNDYEGTMNFYRIRYYLSPMKSINWNSYAYNLDCSSEVDVTNYLNNVDFDYLIVKNCKIIEERFNIPFNSSSGVIFIKNEKSINRTTLQDTITLIGDR